MPTKFSRNLSGCQVFDPDRVPQDWDCVPIGERIELEYGQSLTDEQRQPGPYAVFGSNGAVGTHMKYLKKGPGIVVGRKGTVGAVSYSYGPYWPIDTSYYVSRKGPDNYRFLYYLLSYLPLDFLNAATGVPGLSRRDAYALRGTFPPTHEQETIARVLDAVETTIDLAKIAFDRADAVRIGLEQSLLTRGLTKSGALRQSTEDRPNDYRKTKVGTIPHDWSVTTLKHVSRRIKDGTHQPVTTTQFGIPFLYVSCVRRGRILWEKAAHVSNRDFDVISRGREPIKGSVLYTAVGSYGFAVEVETDHPFTFQRHIAIISPDESKLQGAFLEIWFNSEQGRRWSDILAVGNAQKTVTLSELGKFPIALPPVSEQKLIVAVFRGLKRVAVAHQGKIEGLRNLRRALTRDLISGRVRVPEAVVSAIRLVAQ